MPCSLTQRAQPVPTFNKVCRSIYGPNHLRVDCLHDYLVLTQQNSIQKGLEGISLLVKIDVGSLPLQLYVHTSYPIRKACSIRLCRGGPEVTPQFECRKPIYWLLNLGCIVGNFIYIMINSHL